MRIDKYLKVSRLIKRRELAKELCDAGRISINGRKAKAMSEVKEGDVITILLGKREVEAKVTSVREFASKEQAFAMFEIISDSHLGEA